MTDCPHCHRPDSDHETVVDDGGRRKVFCPTTTPEPETDRDAAIARIREIKRQLEDGAATQGSEQ